MHRGDGTHRALGGVIVRTHRGHGGVIVCMVPTGVVVRVWVLQGLWYMHGSYRVGGACMGPTGVLVRAWVLQRCWCVHVLQGCRCVHRGVGT